MEGTNGFFLALVLIFVIVAPSVECQSKRKRDKSPPNPRPIKKKPSSGGSGGQREGHCKGDEGACGGCGCGYMTGLTGPAGPPGAQGIQGTQGVQGVQGANGLHGHPGNLGDKGQKGKRGFKGRKGDSGGGIGLADNPSLAAPLQIAFSVTMDKDMPKETEYRVVKYNIILTNLGDGYDVDSGVFASPLNGTYMVGFSGVSYHGQNILLHLVKNGQRMLSAFDNSGCSCCAGKSVSKQCAGSGSNVGILGLEQGDKIWIELPDDYGMHNVLYHYYASFYGYLIYQHGEPKKVDRF